MTVIYEDLQTIKKVQVCICDRCGMRVDYANKCFGCGKDVCHDCQPTMNTWIDVLDCDGFTYEYCDVCWKKGDAQRLAIEMLVEKIETYKRFWNEACKK